MSQIEPRLREKIANLSPGGHTDLGIARSGFQIIKLSEERKGDVEPFEAVKDSVYSKLFKEKVEEKYSIWISGLREKSFIKVIF